MEKYALRNTRTIFQRLRDAKFFYGWVTDITGTTVQVIVTTNSIISTVDVFRLHVYGDMCEVGLEGTCTDIRACVKGGSLIQDTYVELNSPYHLLTIELTKPAQAIATQNSARFRLDGSVVSVVNENDANERYDARWLDLSEYGLGLLVDSPLKRGMILQIELPSPNGNALMRGEVRYSSPYVNPELGHRIGVQFLDSGRLNHGRLKEIYRNVRDMNTVYLGRPDAA